VEWPPGERSNALSYFLFLPGMAEVKETHTLKRDRHKGHLTGACSYQNLNHGTNGMIWKGLETSLF
jgi:hypothetical protein